MKPAMVFIGFMGAGKTAALAAAREAGLATTEVDELMERELGMPIAEAFERDGEDAFRARESEVVGGLLEGADGGAIALGGGSVLSERVREALGRHVVVWLQIDTEEAWRRIAGSGRPLARSAEDVARLLAERLPLYEQLADAIVPQGDRGTVARAMPSIQALADLPEETRMLWAAAGSSEYPIFVGRGLLGAGPWPLPGERCCVTDGTVGPLYVDRLAPLAAMVEVPTGESTKTMAEAERVLREMARVGVTRADHVVALGGGVVGDLAGFCAHVYQRGVPVIQVPTTLVAQVDSAYGGKTGVDLPEGKNYVGAYHPPAAVLVDTSTLATLPPEELAAGFVEALKTGLLAGGELWERVGRSSRSTRPSSTTSSLPALATSARSSPPTSATRAFARRSTSATPSATRSRRQAATSATAMGKRSPSACWRRCGSPMPTRCATRSRRSCVATTCRSPSIPRSTSRRPWRPCSAKRRRTADGVAFVLLAEPGEPRTGQILDPGRVREAVEELLP